MKLSIRQRTEYLEALAHRQGLKTAPGARHEGRLLAAALEGLDLGPYAVMHDAETLPQTLWAHYLKAPFALIRMLEAFHPHLLELDRPLRVLYLGAGKDEVLDEGRWFGLAWAMRKISRHRPQLSAVGPELANAPTWEPSPWRSMVDSEPDQMELIPGTMRSNLSFEETCVSWEKHFDLVVMHHPGFVGNLYNWWGDAAWMDLAGFAEVPIVGTSFDAVDLEFDRHGLAASGRIIDRVLWNPAAHVNPAFVDPGWNPLQTRIQWGGVLWSTTRDATFVNGQTSRGQQQALDWFERFYKPLFEDGRDLDGLVNWYYSCPMQFDDVHEHLMVSDDIRIDVRTGRVQAFGQFGEPGPVALQALGHVGLEQRLALMPDLLVELGDRLDLDSADAYAAAQFNGGTFEDFIFEEMMNDVLIEQMAGAYR